MAIYSSGLLRKKHIRFGGLLENYQYLDVGSFISYSLHMFHHIEGKLLECYRCSSPDLIRHGSTSGFAQRYLCKNCRRTFSIGGRKKYNSHERYHIVFRAKQEGLRKIARFFHISPNTIKKWKSTIISNPLGFPLYS